MNLTADQLERCNIDNLTALWRGMGAKPLPGAFAFSAYGHTHWPHRYWIESGERLPTKGELAGFVAALPADCIVPVREGPLAEGLSGALERAGFTVSFEQTAMYRSLDGYSDAGDRAIVLRSGDELTLEHVSSPEGIDAWCSVGGSAFDYVINPQVVAAAATTPGLELYLARLDGAAVATGLLLPTGAVVGVHQVGVDPAFQGRGIARALMQLLLGRCVVLGATHVTLQASAEGEPLYRSMDFTAQFRIRNYARQT